MFDALIQGSLRRPWLVLGAALLLLGLGLLAARRLPVDVLPDLSAPSVTVVTETEGLAPEEAERLVTLPIEQALGGASGVRRIRSSTGIGISLVWIEFEWNVDSAVARQVVSERLSFARGALPRGVEPGLAPASSIMGEIMFVGLVGGEKTSERDLRDTAETLVRRRLLAVSGMAQVVPIGGAVRQLQITLRPERLMALGLGAEQVLQALRQASATTSGGVYVAGAQEYLIRGVGRFGSPETIAATVVAEKDGVPVRVADVAEVAFGDELRRGQAAVDGRSAVVLKLQKQPHADTVDLTARVDRALDEIARSLPQGMSLYRKGFRQADFIQVAIGNVLEVLRDAAVLVAIVLALFLMSWRTTLISLIALPLSLFAGLLVLWLVGASINTMTLGGFAIAIGELVDDAIIDVENVHRRLRQNAALPEPQRRPTLDVVYAASKEIRSSVVFATVIIMLVFAPLFFLSGIEGRLLQPLGLAYVTSIAASLIVALTVTPVLCWLLLGRVQEHAVKPPSRLVRALEAMYRPVLRAVLHVPVPIAVASVGAAALAIVALLSFGRSFLPEFNEGSLNIAAATAPGTSLSTSDQTVARLEKALIAHPAVRSVIRSTGRAEKDEHALDVNFSELEVGLDLSKGDREQVFADVRKVASEIPGLAIAVGQPISHRIEHLVSGVRASLVVKLYGDDLDQLRVLAQNAEAAVRAVPGVVDLAVEQQTEVPELAVVPRSTELASFGMSPGDLARFVKMAFVGESVGTWWSGERAVDVVVKLPDAYRTDELLLRSTPVDLRGTRFAELGQLADIQKTLGPNLVNREDIQRRILVTANVAGRDLRGTALDVQNAVARAVSLPPGYHFSLGGQFESEASASRTILLLSVFALLGMFGLLTYAFRSVRDALLVMVNLPLALLGGAAAVWLGGGTLSIASLVGFITLFGIATRNGIMLLTHYRHLIEQEGMDAPTAVVEGSIHRLTPVLMTALTAALALVPIVLATGQPGNEIQAPMAAVILGGLLSSSALNLLVIPPLFARFGSVQAAPVGNRMRRESTRPYPATPSSAS
jgi:CzcA family heavy metal efflux pump